MRYVYLPPHDYPNGISNVLHETPIEVMSIGQVAAIGPPGKALWEFCLTDEEADIFLRRYPESKYSRVTYYLDTHGSMKRARRVANWRHISTPREIQARIVEGKLLGEEI